MSLPYSNLTGADPELTRMGVAEIVFVALESAVQAFHLAIIIYVFFHRDYPPLKIKQIPVVIGAALGKTKKLKRT
jgi:hypothetical protein